ncbi:hypothetical protein ABT300_14990 [Streptomyces sp. NPDC001027]|uniref:hypothetical protein n=1 Tax=Streptomyces sp. NPDC001027 TaxID=3154771 RepID=UPI003327091F
MATNVREQAPGLKHRGLPNRVIESLGAGFRSATWYELEQGGSVVCLVLRDPARSN